MMSVARMICFRWMFWKMRFPIVLLQKGSGISLLMWRWMVVMFFGLGFGRVFGF